MTKEEGISTSVDVPSAASLTSKQSTKANKDTAEQSAKPAAAALSSDSKKQAFITRTIWTFVMIFGFFGVIVTGHVSLICLVLLFQILTFKEVIRMTSEPARDKKIPYNRSLNWYFLIATLYYLDSQSFVSLLQDDIISNKFLTILVVNHKFISYSLYIAGFVFFVWTLKKGYYKFQFAQLCITHMTLLLVVFQSHLIIDNILNGIIWFFLPCALVIVNDIFAYLCGITFGRTQLIEISPKKTVEGFVGAWVCTGISSIIFSFVLTQSDYLTCPAENLSTHIYNFPHCVPNPVFIPQFYQLPQNIIDLLGGRIEILAIKPIYFHAAMLATFASLIAPFGGFFASGLKRSFGIKDFGDTIPGHGGVTDRIDCQFLMGSFSLLYFQTFISVQNISIGKILQIAIINLSVPQILQLVKSLLKYLNSLKIIEDDKLRVLFDLLDN